MLTERDISDLLTYISIRIQANGKIHFGIPELKGRKLYFVGCKVLSNLSRSFHS